MSIEAIFVLPLLVFVYLAMFVFFDAYRTQNLALRAADTVADLLSRETRAIEPDYIEGMNDVFDFLVNSRYATRLRVTSVGFDADDEAYFVYWSHGTGDQPPLTNATLAELRHRLPIVAEGDSVILVETRVQYRPAFNVGIGARDFLHVIPTRPRFAPRLAWAE